MRADGGTASRGWHDAESARAVESQRNSERMEARSGDRSAPQNACSVRRNTRGRENPCEEEAKEMQRRRRGGRDRQGPRG